MPSFAVMRPHSLSLMLAVAVAATLSLGTAQAAGAQERCEAPPGRAGIEQYCESIPGAGGDRPTSESGNGRVADELPGSAQRALGSSGSAGSAVLNLPSGGDNEGKRGTRRGSLDPAPTSDGGSGGVADALASSADEATSNTPVVVWILIAIALMFAAAVWTRARSSSEPRT
jgi:hypothetical protein